MAVARFFTLNTGHRMPSLGFGTFTLKDDALKEALDYALFLGYRHIDTASTYNNESEIGQVITDHVRARKLSRKNLFITTKIPSTHMRRSDVLEAAQTSLQNLKTTYVDMLLIHHPWPHKKRKDDVIEPEKVDLLESWHGMTDLYKSGQASSVGLSNCTEKQIQRILEASDVLPANLQLECHPYLMQKRLKDFCDKKGIIVSAFAPLGAPNRPNLHKQGSENLLKDPLIVEIAKSYNKSPAQILLNFLFKRGFVVVSKSSNKERIKENRDALKFTITTEDLNRISSLDRGLRFYRYLHYRGHPDFFENEDF